MTTIAPEDTALLPALEVEPGPRWESFEQFRTGGVDGLREKLGADQVGWLNVKGQEFVIMRAQTFSRLYGVAQEVAGLTHQLHLIEQATQLVRDTGGSELAVQHLADLLTQPPARDRRLPSRKPELVFDEDERAQPDDYAAGDMEFELDPIHVQPHWTRG